jgi:hypothetical protein
MQTIHFKVAAQTSFRRFAIADPTYDTVRGRIAELFALDVNASWSLRYRDEEKEMISKTIRIGGLNHNIRLLIQPQFLVTEL